MEKFIQYQVGQLRSFIDEQYAAIETAQETLKVLRKSCEHKSFRMGNYGDIRNYRMTRICEDCDSPMGDDGCYTFIFKNIHKDIDALKKVVCNNFQNYIKIQGQDGKTEIKIPDGDEYKIEITVCKILSMKPEDMERMDRAATPEQSKIMMEKIVKEAKEAGIELEVKNYI